MTSDPRFEKTSLQTYLALLHKVQTVIQVQPLSRNRSGGAVVTWEDRACPGRICKWNDYPKIRRDIYDNMIERCSRLGIQQYFPNTTVLEYMRERRHENPVGTENDATHALKDCVFEPLCQIHKFLANGQDHEFSKRLLFSDTPPNEPDYSRSGKGASDATKSQGSASSNRKDVKPDLFCLVTDEEDQEAVKFVVEIKPPHKLPVKTIERGLNGDITLDGDVFKRLMNNPTMATSVVESDDPKWTMAAIVSQAYGYMLYAAVDTGVIVTTEAVVVLRLSPDNRSDVLYYIVVPKEAYSPEDEFRLEHTFVFQLLCLSVSAGSLSDIGQDELDQLRGREQWSRNFKTEDTMDDQDESSPDSPGDPTYKGSNKRRRDDEPDDGAGPSSGTRAAKKSRSEQGVRGSQAESAPPDGGPGQQGRPNQAPMSRAKFMRIPFCSHKCLLGLVKGSSTDSSCPNAARHGTEHAKLTEVIEGLRHQLNDKDDRRMGCEPLNGRVGSRGKLYKVHHWSTGYTMIGKGVVDDDREHLQHEEYIYRKLYRYQATHFPVCVGTMELLRPYHTSCREDSVMLLLSYAGDSVDKAIGQYTAKQVELMLSDFTAAVEALRSLDVRHGDLRASNILVDDALNIMIVDFERSVHGKAVAKRCDDLKSSHDELRVCLQERHI